MAGGSRFGWAGSGRVLEAHGGEGGMVEKKGAALGTDTDRLFGENFP